MKAQRPSAWVARAGRVLATCPCSSAAARPAHGQVAKKRPARATPSAICSLQSAICNPHHRRGATLLEVLVAAVILATGAAMGLAAISSSLSLATHTARRNHAHQLAAEQLARAAAGEYAQWPATGETRLQGAAYTWRVDRTTASGRLLRLTCQVQWQSRGRPQQLQLERLALPPEATP